MAGLEGAEHENGDARVIGVDIGPQRLPLLSSPYRRTLDGGESRSQSAVSLVVHGSAGLLAACWFMAQLVQESSNRAVPASLLVGSLFVVVAPALVARWESRFRQFETELRTVDALREDAWARISEMVGRVAATRSVLVAIPVVLITVAYVAGRQHLSEELGLPRSGILFVVGLIILQLGSIAAGWGIHGAVVTIAVAAASTQQRADFAPYAGTPSRASRALGGLCFSTALMYGAAGALLMPGLCAAIWGAGGLARWALGTIVVMVLVVTAALLAVPAFLLSRRSQEDQASYLDRLADQIDELGRAASSSNAPFGGDEYRRLRALLEMRTHVVAHTVQDSAVEMVKRIPLAVLLPAASVAASWLSLMVS